MKQTIKGNIPIGGIKRCYVEGAAIHAVCPGCGAKLTHDFGDQYLNYPEVGKETEAYFYCAACDEADRGECEWEFPIKVLSATVEIEYDTTSLK